MGRTLWDVTTARGREERYQNATIIMRHTGQASDWSGHAFELFKADYAIAAYSWSYSPPDWDGYHAAHRRYLREYPNRANPKSNDGDEFGHLC